MICIHYLEFKRQVATVLTVWIKATFTSYILLCHTHYSDNHVLIMEIKVKAKERKWEKKGKNRETIEAKNKMTCIQ